MKAKEYLFVRWAARPGASTRWHVQREDGKTVCGREVVRAGFERMRRQHLSTNKEACAECLRMKDADTVAPRLA